MSPFEITMLVCFGAAWPLSIYKSWKTRQVAGKSVLFLIVIFVGYIAGTIHKIFYRFDYVIVLYILNGLMVMVDTILYFRNRLERAAASAKARGQAGRDRGDTGTKALVVYASRYGSSERCARLLAERIRGGAEVANLGARAGTSLPELLGSAEVVVVLGPIYAGKLMGAVGRFCERHRQELLERRLALAICCLERGERAREELAAAYPESLAAHAFSRRILGGEVRVSALKGLDRLLYRRLVADSTDVSRIDMQEIEALAAEVNALQSH